MGKICPTSSLRDSSKSEAPTGFQACEQSRLGADGLFGVYGAVGHMQDLTRKKSKSKRGEDAVSPGKGAQG